eukprot:GEMP01030832.1.p1 GENE.GEMP01030832.1~~GEMP01030832.1.p1  ORF type:complete len:279 (+),score=72.40 GEMP01030832.1:185-1021(+)
MAEHQDQVYLEQPATGRPFLNTFDMPELMDGAQPGATNVQREAFEARCKKVWRSDQWHEQDINDQGTNDASHGLYVKESEVDGFLEMFSKVDASLVRSLYYEFGSERCMQELLAISASTNEVTAQLPKLDPKIEIDNENLFPPLTDAQGWQIINSVVAKEQPESSQWRDCCALAKDIPTAELPKPNKQPALRARDHNRKKKARSRSDEFYNIDDNNEDNGVLDENDLRRKCGERHAARKCWGKKPPASPTGDSDSDKEEKEACVLDDPWMGPWIHVTR